jgi:putative hemolysin
MDDLVTTFLILLLIILVAFSAFFSASETAFTSVRKVRLQNLSNEGNKRAAKALAMANNYDRLLTTILVGNNLVNIMSSSICTWLFTDWFGAWGVAFATLFMLLVLLSCGEITPKTLAKSNAERYAMEFVPLLSTVMTVLSPICWFFMKMTGTVGKFARKDSKNAPTITEDELVVMIDQIEGEGTLEKSESELIKSAIKFDDKTVSEILIPRVDIVAVEKGSKMDDMKKIFLSSGFSRLPVYEGTIDRIIGVIYAKDFYSKYFDGDKELAEGLMRPVKFLPETTTVARALSEIQRSMVQMVVIVDSYGGTLGIVTLEDVLEELVGEIWDESDEVRHDIVKEADGSFAVLGEANIEDLMEQTGVSFSVGDYDDHTVGGYIQYRLNRVPVKGDRVEKDGVTMIVRATKNRRIKLVQVIVKKDQAKAEQSA